MKILIEGYAYDRAVVKGAIPGNGLLFPNNDGKIPIDRVGYYRSPDCDDFIFFLPKVLLEPVKIDGQVVDRVFCRWQGEGADRTLISSFTPEQIVDLNVNENGEHPLLPKDAVDFLYGFAVWIYQAIARFDATHPGTGVVWKGNVDQSGAFKRSYETNTLLDVILALRRFNRDNQSYFLFKVQEKHSGNNKINWTRTIARSTAIVQNGVPVYLDLLNKKKVIDFDEELLVIYYSILNYIRRKYNFDVSIAIGFDLITEDRFERYLEGYGETRLRQIKYKYFSDRDLEMWELCFAFFSKAHKTNVASAEEEYLVAKDFEIVFEAMIDDLLGDPKLASLKELSDGKEIDHLYVDESLVRLDRQRTFCIADSKYYKQGNSLGEESVAKQFTYARDVLQLDLNLFMSEENELADRRKKVRGELAGSGLGMLRDEMTEGYDIIPNFFISATMSPDFDYEDDLISPRNNETNGDFMNLHFENRLYDRDTLLLSHYNVNFLYVLKLYTQDDDSAKAAWRRKARLTFRKNIRDLLCGGESDNGYFEFYAIMPHEGIDEQVFFEENFKYLLGKVCAPYRSVEGRRVYSLALAHEGHLVQDPSLTREGNEARNERVRKENPQILELLRTAFYVVPCKLGEDPTPKLLKEKTDHPMSHSSSGFSATAGVQVVSCVKGPLTAAVKNTGLCPCPENQCTDAGAVKILVLPHTQGANLFNVVEGCVPILQNTGALPEAFKNVTFPAEKCWVWHVAVE